MKILRIKSTGEFKSWPREDEGDVIGLDTGTFDIYTLTEHDRPTFDAGTHYLQRTEVIDEQAKTFVRGWDIIAREQPPVVVTMRSFRLACGRVLWVAIESAIAANPDADARWEAEQFIEHSPTVSRAHPLVAQLAAAIGKTDAEVDAVFASAQTLDIQA